MNSRARYGYLTYADMIKKISDGKLDAYDIVYAKDTKECYIITEDLTPSPIQSKVRVFDNVKIAETVLNESIGTYCGQVIAILRNDVYVGYIVNFNQRDDLFYVTPLYEHPDVIDYNTLNNRPITNLVGTIEKRIIISELDPGIYNIRGEYVIASTDATVNLSAKNILFVVDNGKITKITSDEIIYYEISDNSVVSQNKVATEKYLDGYTTIDYVDTKIAALEQIVEQLDTNINQVIGDKVDERLNEIVKFTNTEEIKSLFY